MKRSFREKQWPDMNEGIAIGGSKETGRCAIPLAEAHILNVDDHVPRLDED